MEVLLAEAVVVAANTEYPVVYPRAPWPMYLHVPPTPSAQYVIDPYLTKVGGTEYWPGGNR